MVGITYLAWEADREQSAEQSLAAAIALFQQRFGPRAQRGAGAAWGQQSLLARPEIQPGAATYRHARSGWARTLLLSSQRHTRAELRNQQHCTAELPAPKQPIVSQSPDSQRLTVV